MADHDDDIELDASDRTAERRLAEWAGLIPLRRSKTRPTVRETAEAHLCPGEQNPKTL